VETTARLARLFVSFVVGGAGVLVRAPLAVAVAVAVASAGR
jgi:hypothetical protein